MKNNFYLNKFEIGNVVNLKGWVNKSRRLGELIFIDLRSGSNIVQLVISKKSDFFDIANNIRSEFVLDVTGEVKKRKTPNPELKSGEIELELSQLIIINSSKQTPIIIRDETDALEKKRMEYTYLDLRRPTNNSMLKLRSKFNRIIRDYFYSNNFIEIETPIITKPSPGGAEELNVLSKQHKGKHYSLVQSPQIYKQLLMYSGIEKYFQIAKCFRDEDSRSDRQLEFTQLDMELSFSTEEEIREIINKLLSIITKNFRQQENFEFPILTHKEAIETYGSDKPDIRFENKIYDLTEILMDTPTKFISDGINSGKQVKSVFFEGGLSNSEIKKIDETIKSQGSSGLAWVKISDEISGSLKLISEKNISDIKEKINILKDGILFLVIDDKTDALEYMGRVRLLVANSLEIIDKNKLSFVWVRKFPLFKKNREGFFESVHNPFTSVLTEEIEEFRCLNIDSDKLLELHSNAYDIVLNGSEIGGGAIRISTSDDQKKIFNILGIKNDDIEENFGWLLEAQKYGIPTHGGIALGLNRLLSILLNKETIRDVIAFPKTTSGTDEMMEMPIISKG